MMHSNPIMRTAIVMLLGWVALTPAHAQTAGTFENLDRIDSLVSMTVGAALGEPGGPVAPVDRRLRLAACPQMPRVDGPQFSAAIVSCPQIGWRIRVPLAPGGANVAATPSHVSLTRQSTQAPNAPLVIKKGDPVQLLAGDSSFAVSRMVIAEENGAEGALIRVRGDSKSQPVSARVEGPGIVRIPGI
jgi:flagellar basal body P-ring formation protein FlgA